MGHASRSDDQKYDGKTFTVSHVVDGDTIDLAVPDGRSDHTRVHLRDVDTPEAKKKDTPEPSTHAREESNLLSARHAAGAAPGEDENGVGAVNWNDVDRRRN